MTSDQLEAALAAAYLRGIDWVQDNGHSEYRHKAAADYADKTVNGQRMMDLSEAISLAVTAHDGQTDKGDKAYILHSLRVMLAMRSETDRIVAVLHDVVEDCPGWQLQDLHAFGPEVVAAIDALTRRERELYGDYISRVSENEIATRVKLADLRDNLDIGRLSEVTAADEARCERYRQAHAALLDAAMSARDRVAPTAA